jgi:hypothetical protein
MPRSLAITIQPGTYSICKLSPGDLASEWMSNLFECPSPMFSTLSRTPTELSLVCEEHWPPADVRQERGFALLKLGEQFDLNQIGLFVSAAEPLAQAGLSIVPIATFDTDYILIKRSELPPAIAALVAAGHTVA